MEVYDFRLRKHTQGKCEKSSMTVIKYLELHVIHLERVRINQCVLTQILLLICTQLALGLCA
jgi:hypothetical protein